MTTKRPIISNMLAEFSLIKLRHFKKGSLGVPDKQLSSREMLTIIMFIISMI